MILEIEKIEAKDIGVINKIQKLAFKASYDKYRFCQAYKVTDDEILSFLERAIGYKILLNRVVIGSILICKISNSHYELNTISINPKFQNIGVGSKVILQVEKMHPDVLVWTLSTPDSDERNRHYYEKLGYIKAGTEFITEYLTLAHYKKEIEVLL